MEGRRLDDDGSVLLRFEGGARGLLWASQIAVGEENGLRLRVYGETGGIEWRQLEPNTLVVHKPDGPTEVRRTATPFVGAAASSSFRLPAGHPEGFIEAFANLYNSFADAVCDVLGGNAVDESDYDYPNVRDGVRGIAFLDAVVRSSNGDEKWVRFSG